MLTCVRADENRVSNCQNSSDRLCYSAGSPLLDLAHPVFSVVSDCLLYPWCVEEGVGEKGLTDDRRTSLVGPSVRDDTKKKKIKLMGLNRKVLVYVT